MTGASLEALRSLRDPGLFQWYVIPFLALTVYVYAVEIERRNWNAVLAGLAFVGMDILNEISNALVLHASRRSALWTIAGGTSYLIFVGLTIEILFFFAIAGIVFPKLLPRDKSLRVLGVPNRWFFAVANSLLCVAVEIALNRAGVLVWEYSWWSFPNVFLVFLFGYLTFFIVSFWVLDMESRSRQLAVVGTIFAVDLIAILVFGVKLGWI